jgi:hypothetical protein
MRFTDRADDVVVDEITESQNFPGMSFPAFGPETCVLCLIWDELIDVYCRPRPLL